MINILAILIFVIFCILIYVGFDLVKTMVFPSPTHPPSIYAKRKLEFTNNMDERQHIQSAEFRGASTVEVTMTLEKRIYDLEQRLNAAERRTLDDGK